MEKTVRTTRRMWMQTRTTSRRARIGLRALAPGLALGALLAAGASHAVSIATGVVQLPAAGAETVDLGATPAGPAAGFSQWARLSPNAPADPNADYALPNPSGSSAGLGSGTPGDAWVYNLSFDFTWAGTVGGDAPGGPHSDQILFTIVDSRYRNCSTCGTFATTGDLPQSGFVNGSFLVDGSPVTPDIVLDDTGAMSGNAQGFVSDAPGNRWLGFWLPANDATHTISMQWALGQTPPGSSIFFPTAAFIAVPEPATAALLGAALALGLGLRARRRVR